MSNLGPDINSDDGLFWIKDHVNKEEFAAGVKAEYELDCNPEDVEHSYWRFVPGPDMWGENEHGYYIPAKKGKQGAFPVTEWRKGT